MIDPIGHICLAPPAVVRPLVDIAPDGAGERIEFVLGAPEADVLDMDAEAFCAVA